jgi:hypothetical protein
MTKQEHLNDLKEFFNQVLDKNQAEMVMRLMNSTFNFAYSKGKYDGIVQIMEAGSDKFDTQTEHGVINKSKLVNKESVIL